MPDTITLERTSAALVMDAKPPVVIIDPQAPASAELKALLADVEQRMKLSFAMAAAGATPPQATGVDALFRSLIESRPEAVRNRMRAHAQTLLSAPAAVRQTFFGRYGAVEARNYRSAEQLKASVARPAIDGRKLKASLEAFGKNDAALAEVQPAALKAIDLPRLRKLKPIDPDVVAGAKYKKLGLFLKKVHCFEETDEWSASDEIAMGGTATDPDGDTHKIGQFMVSDDFDAGETKTYAGKGKLLHEWNIVRSDNWPHVYAAILCMAEKDGSGFGDFLTNLWKAVGEEVKQAIAGAVGSAIGAALGSFFGPVGTAVGAAVGALIGLLVDWILSWFEDDLIKCRTILLGLGAATKSYYDWAGLTANPPNLFSMNFNGDGGRYRVWCSLSVYP